MQPPVLVAGRVHYAGHGTERHALPATDHVSAVAVAPDGSWLASGGFDATVRIWDRVTGSAVSLRIETALCDLVVGDQLLAAVGGRGLYLLRRVSLSGQTQV